MLRARAARLEASYREKKASIPSKKLEGSRRSLMSGMVGVVAGNLSWTGRSRQALAVVEELPLLAGKDYGKSRTVYPDFEMKESGLQYKDILVGKGREVGSGDNVVVDWAGCTIGYYARIFEARNKAKGGSFVGEDKDFLRFQVGDNSIIPAFNEALQGMKVGGIRRIIVSPGTGLGYPDDSFDKGVGPRPSTFSGRRALSFVLGNQGLIDKSLLFDIELIKIA